MFLPLSLKLVFWAVAAAMSMLLSNFSNSETLSAKEVSLNFSMKILSSLAKYVK